MANTLTPNLGLKKPSGDMNVSRTDMNDNWDAIDAANLTKKGTEIAASTDLNSLTTPGKYCSINAGRSATLINTPFTAGGFSLYVLVQASGVASGNQPIIAQLLTPSSASDSDRMPYYRTYISGGIWTSWKHFLSEDADLTQRGTSIPDNADLNTYVTPGKYYCTNATRAATLSNTPVTGSGFSLYVLKQSTEYTTQIVIANSNARLIYTPFYRSRLGDKWYSWLHLTSDESVRNKLTATGTTNANGNLTITLPKKGIITAAWTESSNTMVTVFPAGSSDEDGSTTWYAHVTDVSATPVAKTNTQFTAHVIYIDTTSVA